MMFRIRIPIFIVSLFFFTGSIAHFIYPNFFIQAMPDYLGYHLEIVIISGLFELFGAVGLLIARTRLLAGYSLIALSIAVFPANLNMALHPEKFVNIDEVYLYLRLPLQLLIIWFIWWAVKIERLNKISGTKY